MTTSLFPSRAPFCLSCLRRTLTPHPEPFTTPFRTQYRGKKKLPSATTIPVRLLKDVPRYGRKHSLIAIPNATMRNSFFPRGTAAYLTMDERRTLKAEVGERDYTYGLPETKGEKTAAVGGTASSSGTPKSFVPQLSAERTVELLQKFVPPVLEYFRTPIATPALTSAGSALGTEEWDSQKQLGTTMGTVTPVTNQDIAETIKRKLKEGAAVAGEGQAAKVVVTAGDVYIKGSVDPLGRGVEEAGDAVDRVVTLGDFEVIVTVRGGGDIVRKMRVLAEAAPPEVMANPMTDGPRSSV